MQATKKYIDAHTLYRYRAPMDITPKDIEEGALRVRVTLSAVLARAGVSRGTFYRARRGAGDMLPLTKARLMDAIAAFEAEQEAA